MRCLQMWYHRVCTPSQCTPAQDALRPAQNAAQGAIQQLARLVSQQPDLQFPISADRAQTWLINTYLDDVCHSLCYDGSVLDYSACQRALAGRVRENEVLR